MTNPVQDQVRVGVFGGSGYIGAELLRYLCSHPGATVSWVTAHSRVGQEIAGVLPNLKGAMPGSFVSQAEGEERIGEVDVAFTALPHNESQNLLPKLAEANPTEIDSSGDLGYCAGTYRFDVSGVEKTGKFVTILRRQADGSWKAAVDAMIRDSAAAT